VENGTKQEKKFVIGTGDHKVFVGFWEDSNKWWYMASLKKINKSSVSTIDFHPSGKVIGIGSLDFSFRIVSCNLTNYEKHYEDAEDNTYKGPFDSILSFGEELFII